MVGLAGAVGCPTICIVGHPIRCSLLKAYSLSISWPWVDSALQFLSVLFVSRVLRPLTALRTGEFWPDHFYLNHQHCLDKQNTTTILHRCIRKEALSIWVWRVGARNQNTVEEAEECLWIHLFELEEECIIAMPLHIWINKIKHNLWD